MTFKTIFAPLAFEETAKLVSETALLLAGAFKGHVMAQHVRPRFTGYPPMEFYPASASATMMAMEAHDQATSRYARGLRTKFEGLCAALDAHVVPVPEALKQNGVTASWTEEVGQFPLNYGLSARAADLVVMAIPDAKGPHPERELFEAVLMQSGAPVFLTPRSGLSAVPRRPLVAWDGSLQASRVVRAALPLLLQSDETTLLTIGETDAATPSLEQAKLWLERAGVLVTSRHVEWPERPIAERILNQCEASNSDVVLMGGYSHSRLRESIMGGVTLHMIQHADLPILMVH